MARPTISERMAKVHASALAEFDRIQSALKNERQQCLNDRRFYSIAGAQWEGSFGEQFENRPRLEVNKIHMAVLRIISEYRNNRITVDFVSKEGDEYDSLAETCDQLYRADEQDSGAQEAYDNAFEEAVGGGFGAWRLRAVYENEYDEDDERQRIRIEPIFDADSSVWFDLDAKRQDKGDAKCCFVLTALTRESYTERFGDDPATWPKDIHGVEFDWLTPDVVYIAEYYEVEESSELVFTYEALDGTEEKYRKSDFDADPELADRLAAIGSREVRQRRVKRKRVHKYLLSGGKVLEDQGYIAGTCIPIVPVYGKRWFVDNVERCMGHVRLAKDAQRLKNMQLSQLAETAALSSLEKPILLPEQVAGHQQMWAEDNLRRYPYLLVNPITDATGNPMPSGPVAYTRSPAIPPAMAALLQVTETDMQEILGNQAQGDKIVSNISGKAIEAIQQRLDMQTFIYMSNMAKAVRRSGEIWLSMARDVYVEAKRSMKGVGVQGELNTIELMRPMIDKESGEIEYENDLSEAMFDVAAEVGPASQSQRQATVRALTNIMAVTDDPSTKAILQSMVLMNIEGDGLEDLRDFFRQQLVRMGVVKPTDEEAQAMAMAAAQQQPDPQALYLQAAAEQAMAEATKARADTVLTVARAQESQAKAAKTLSDMDISQQEAALQTVQTLGQVPATDDEAAALVRLYTSGGVQ